MDKEMNYGDAYLNGLIDSYKKQLRAQKVELKNLPDGTLFMRKQGKSRQYMHIVQLEEQDRSIRNGITRNQTMINKLARKKYLEISNNLLVDEIAKIEKFLETHIEPTAGNVLKLMPKAYRELPENSFFPERRKANAWANAPYEQNTAFLENKIHITGKGLKVRSKSELIIAEKLDSYGIPYRYDAIIHYGSHSFSPDFMFMTGEGLIYWEHCGMMNLPKYRSYNKWKLSMYERMGIVPWKNLIITYDTEDGGLSSAIIESEIRNRLLPLM